MTRTRLLLAAISALALMLSPVSAGAFSLTATDLLGGAAAEDDVVKTDNVTRIGGFSYTGGSEVAFDGRYAYAGQINGDTRRNTKPNQGGVFVIDLVGDAEAGITPGDQVGKLECPGTDNYVVPMDPALHDGRELVAVSHHSNTCNPVVTGNGLMIVDVTDKTNPVPIGGIGAPSAHTVTMHPTKPFAYILPGGIANGAGQTIIVDLTDPEKPVQAGVFRSSQLGCHDLQFSANGDFAFCAGLTEVQVWDTTKVAAPRTVSRIANPAIQFPHNALPSPDGTMLVINDEAFGAHECASGTSIFGSLWIYDITDPLVPVLQGRIAPPETPTAVRDHGVGNLNGWVDSWCAAHNYNFVPGTDVLVSSWFAGGTLVHDLSNPLFPEQLAQYQPQGGVAYTAHYYGGYVVTNDMRRGFEVLDIPELRDLEAEADPNTAERISRTPVDMSDVLIPAVLPVRPPRAVPTEQNTGICVLPAL
jgi:hypothetical protein